MQRQKPERESPSSGSGGGVPEVSVVMPTYNRRATVLRAVRSVLDQSFRDWELIVVDDGSTDGTSALLDGLDPRVRVIVQENGGAAAARNVGVAACRGRSITFLDSDDEWLPCFLALACGFLDRHPGEAWVATESLESVPDGRWLRQDRHALCGHYVSLARRLGSSALRQPEGVDDDYLRVYERREPLGEWASSLATGAGAGDGEVYWYRGRIGDHYRWGYFHALWCIVVRADAAREAGPFPEERRTCNDFEFLVRLAMRHDCNLVAVPAVRKHLLRASDHESAAGQLSTGKAYVGFTRNYASAFHDAFVDRYPTDAEVLRIYAFRKLEAARAALQFGLRAEAREHLRVAAQWLDWPSVRILRAVARLSPSDRTASVLYWAYRRLADRIPALA